MRGSGEHDHTTGQRDGTGCRVGLLRRGEAGLLCRRFDWFTGRAGDGPRREERRNGLERIVIGAVIMCFMT